MAESEIDAKSPESCSTFFPLHLLGWKWSVWLKRWSPSLLNLCPKVISPFPQMSRLMPVLFNVHVVLPWMEKIFSSTTYPIILFWKGNLSGKSNIKSSGNILRFVCVYFSHRLNLHSSAIRQKGGKTVPHTPLKGEKLLKQLAECTIQSGKIKFSSNISWKRQKNTCVQDVFSFGLICCFIILSYYQ